MMETSVHRNSIGSGIPHSSRTWCVNGNEEKIVILHGKMVN